MVEGAGEALKSEGGVLVTTKMGPLRSVHGELGSVP